MLLPLDKAGVAAFAGEPASRGGAANYGGAVDTINCSSISGWAFNGANLAEKIMVDVLVDDKIVGTTPAISPRPDLHKIAGIPNFGFGYQIPPGLKDGKPHTVRARISGSGNEIRVWENIKPSFTCSPE